MSPIQIVEAIDVAALVIATIIALVCMLEFRYMDDPPSQPPRPPFPPAVRLGDRELRDLYTTHTDLAQKPDGKGRSSE